MAGARRLLQHYHYHLGSELLKTTGSGSNAQGSAGWRLLPTALATLMGGAALLETAQLEAPKTQEDLGSGLPAEHPASERGWSLLDTSTRRRLFYKYERRVRDLSQTDKVFHYFASQAAADGTRVMSLSDLVRAVVAVYPPELSGESRSGGLAGEPKKRRPKRRRSYGETGTKDSRFLKAFDIDNDGISYSEYLLLSTFLKIPAQDVTVVFQMFDLNGDGKVHVREFEEITSALQAKLRRVSSVQRTGASITPADSSRGLKRYLFGEDGGKSMKLEDFTEFIKGLHEEMLRLEFEHYDIDADETITGLDFARSIASYADLADVDKYLDRAASLPPEVKTMKVSYEEFQHFAALHQQVHSLGVALDFYHNIGGKLERDDFKRATGIVSGRPLPDGLVEIVFHMFDTDHDGDMSQHELMGVLRKRGGSWAGGHSVDHQRPPSLLSCLLACVT